MKLVHTRTWDEAFISLIFLSFPHAWLGFFPYCSSILSDIHQKPWFPGAQAMHPDRYHYIQQPGQDMCATSMGTWNACGCFSHIKEMSALFQWKVLKWRRLKSCIDLPTRQQQCNMPWPWPTWPAAGVASLEHSTSSLRKPAQRAGNVTSLVMRQRTFAYYVHLFRSGDTHV